MKRKFFSALLLMTLSVSSVGMFVSCKDYDDDINGVRDDVSSLRTELTNVKEDLEQQLSDAEGSFAAQIQNAIAGKADQSEVDELKALLEGVRSNLQAQIDAANEAIEELRNGNQEEAEATLAALTGRVDDLDNKLAAVEKSLEIQQEALDDFKEAITAAVNTKADELAGLIETVQEKISAIQATVAAQGGDIDALKKSMEEAETALKTLDSAVNGLTGQLDALKVLIEKTLSSLVFSPDFYYGGIEAMEATTINYTPVMLQNDSPADKPSAAGETWKSGKAASLTPAITASYHMNPSYFDVNKITAIDVVSDDKDYIALGETRAAKSGPSVLKDSWKELSKDGMLTVRLNLDASKLETSKDKVTVLAIQAKFNTAGVDTTVTSDYAAVAQSTIHDVVIADPTVGGDASVCTEKKFHIYTTAEMAISNEPTHNLVYNDADGIDLTTLAASHFVRNGASGESVMDDVAKYGMKWEFAESHYVAGNNETSESAHIYLKDNHVIACTVDANGKPQPGSQDRSSIGRMPMVRVTLVDTTKTTPQVVAVGFIKFKITDKEAQSSEDIDIDFSDNGYNLSCTDYNFTQTWAQVESLVLSRVNMSKAEFEANYAVEKVTGSTDQCQLYAHDDKGEIVKASRYGTVTEKVDAQSHETTVLSWDIPAADIYAAVWDATKDAYKTGVNLETGVRFVSKNTAEPDVYVWFHTGTITVPTAALSNEYKIKENWAAANGAIGSGYDEIHNNVEVVGEPNAADRFSQDILSTFVRNDITLDIKGSDAFKAENLTYTFKFIISDAYKTQTGQSGNKYTMSTSTDGSVLYASLKGTKQEVAKLSTNFDDVTSAKGINSVVQYQKTDFAKDLLNAVSHKNIAKSVTATVGIYAVNKCGQQLPIENNTFDIKFLRPLDVSGADAQTFTDAATGGNKVDMYRLVKFTDWRDQWNEAWITYYGVASIEAVEEGITTTLNGGKLGETLLSDVTSAVEFEYNATGASKSYGGKDFGYLYYGNNGSVTQTFQIRVPLKVTYEWGEITTATVDITVNPTAANTNSRR